MSETRKIDRVRLAIYCVAVIGEAVRVVGTHEKERSC
jgi:hypothetical protein